MSRRSRSFSKKIIAGAAALAILTGASNSHAKPAVKRDEVESPGPQHAGEITTSKFLPIVTDPTGATKLIVEQDFTYPLKQMHELMKKTSDALFSFDFIPLSFRPLYRSELNNLSLSTTTADGPQCTADDLAIWSKGTGKTNFKSYMTTCGKQCWGAEACVATCVDKEEHYSQPCATCFGQLGQCSRDHCMLQCMNGNTPACAACERKYCVQPFSECTGIAVDDIPKEMFLHDHLSSKTGGEQAAGLGAEMEKKTGPKATDKKEPATEQWI
ncbi:unnamed protein product [Amoebophrya sp. A120]|nr:unnamed protein product [Amoebophrya sp. A120]|eukprot:GSA120T00008933001.1